MSIKLIIPASALALFTACLSMPGTSRAPREAADSNPAAASRTTPEMTVATSADSGPTQPFKNAEGFWEVPRGAGYFPEDVEFPSGGQILHGFLWRPPGQGPFPAILFSHGSEKFPGAKDGQAMFYVPHGYVLFVPHRRGQGRSRQAGRYIDDIYDAGAPGAPAFTEELLAQVGDVKAAAAYLATLPYVDSERVAAIGCSLGGIESLFAAERVPGLRAAVDFEGASHTWANDPPLQARMKEAARNAKVPVLFLQAENDADTTPRRVLSQLMTSAGKKSRLHIYPPNGTTAEQGHDFCTPDGPVPDLRHCFVTSLFKLGVGASTVRDLAGHRHMHVTARYAHSDDGSRRTAIAALGGQAS